MKKKLIPVIVLMLVTIGLFSGCVEETKVVPNADYDTYDVEDKTEAQEAEEDDEPDDLVEIIFGDDSYLRMIFDVKITWETPWFEDNYVGYEVKAVDKYWAPTVTNPMQMLYWATGKNVKAHITLTCEGETYAFEYSLGDITLKQGPWKHRFDVDFEGIKKSEYEGGKITWKVVVREGGTDYSVVCSNSGSFTMPTGD